MRCSVLRCGRHVFWRFLILQNIGVSIRRLIVRMVTFSGFLVRPSGGLKLNTPTVYWDYIGLQVNGMTSIRLLDYIEDVLDHACF